MPSTREGTQAECERHAHTAPPCEVLALGGRAAFGGISVSIDAVLPGPKDPKVVMATSWSGGTACCWTAYLIDLTRGEPIVLEDVPAFHDDKSGSAARSSATGLTYQSREGGGLLGEPTAVVYRYRYGSGKVEKIESTTIYSYSPMHEKRHPDALFNDPVRRAPLLKVTGPAEFKELRSRIQTSGPPERPSDSVYVWSGCQAQLCSYSEGIFVIDVARNQAWAMYFESDSGKFFGVLTPRDTEVVRALARWMGEHGMRWDQFVVATSAAALNHR